MKAEKMRIKWWDLLISFKKERRKRGRRKRGGKEENVASNLSVGVCFGEYIKDKMIAGVFLSAIVDNLLSEVRICQDFLAHKCWSGICPVLVGTNNYSY
jgi:hypothetical protein